VEAKVKRAITLAGGGPAAGLHLGVLSRLSEAGITFDNEGDVWALSCIGAWVGLVYNQCEPDKRVEQTRTFFKDGIFRDDPTYSAFPLNRVFGPDWRANSKSLIRFLADPDTYEKIVAPCLHQNAPECSQGSLAWWQSKISDAIEETAHFLSNRSKWTEGDFNQLVFNHGLAINPFIRFLSSMMFLSNVNGLARIHYPDSSFAKSIDFEKTNSRPPFIFHNAYNLTDKTLDLFCNKDTEQWRSDGYKAISFASLCACSALPYIEQTIDIGGKTYCEGALIDTVNFKNLVEDHELDEIWISRIVDKDQIRQPKNLANSLANLCQLFAATVGEDDIRLFECHVREKNKWHGTIIEIEVNANINFDWTRSNFDNCEKLGRDAAYRAYKRYKDAGGDQPNNTGKVRIIKGKPDDSEVQLAAAQKEIEDLKQELEKLRAGGNP